MNEVDPFGRKLSSRRLSDEETAERMLETAVEKVRDQGLRVTFELMRYEEIISDAAVARSAVYRQWPTKNHFYADLLRVLSERCRRANEQRLNNDVQLMMATLFIDPNALATPASRLTLLSEQVRNVLNTEVGHLEESPEWRINMALAASLVTLPEASELQSDLQENLAAASVAYESLAAQLVTETLTALGFRWKDTHSGESYETVFAGLVKALIEGFALQRSCNPASGREKVLADPFLTGELAEWSNSAIAFASVLASFIEVDPATAGDWDANQIALKHADIDRYLKALDTLVDRLR